MKSMNYLYILLILFFYFPIYLKVLKSEICISFYLVLDIKEFSSKIKLFFGLVTTESSSFRRNLIYNMWIKQIIKLGHDYVFCTQNKIEPKYNWIPLKDWSNSTYVIFNPDRDRENKRITMADFFLKNTKADFFINPTDDVFVDTSRIDKLAYILGKKYNTENDSVLLGDCIIGGYMIQGGSGYIMSRKMARKFVKYSKKWLNESKGPDDVEIRRFLSYVKKTASDTSSPYLSGRGFIGLESTNFDASKLSICPKYFDKTCNIGINKLEDTFLMHPNLRNITKDLTVWSNFLKLQLDNKHKYGWHSNYNNAHTICVLNSSNMG